MSAGNFLFGRIWFRNTFPEKYSHPKTEVIFIGDQLHGSKATASLSLLLFMGPSVQTWRRLADGAVTKGTDLR